MCAVEENHLKIVQMLIEEYGYDVTYTVQGNLSVSFISQDYVFIQV